MTAPGPRRLDRDAALALRDDGLDCHVRVDERGVDVSFSVQAGTCLALLGANGTGKSTVLDALAGWLRPDAGHAMLHDRLLFRVVDPDTSPPAVPGRERRARNPRDAAATAAWMPAHRRRVGYLTQDPGLFPHLSAEANVAYGMPRAGISGRAARRRAARHWLAEVGIGQLADRRPHELSGGQAQRVAIARVLASDPALVLLDEPLAAMDVHMAPRLRELLAQVLTGRTSVLVSHHLADADALAHRRITLPDRNSGSGAAPPSGHDD